MKKIIITFTSFLFVIVALAQSGNIGIATPTPGGKLQINHKNTGSSPSLILFDSASGTGSKLLFTKQSQGNTFSFLSTIDVFAANSSLDIRTTFNSGILLRGDGRVGINNITSPTATLHVGGGVKINDTLHIVKGVKMEDTLNVGGDINIEGNLKINGNAGTPNQVLVSNGSTNSPSWTELNTSGDVGFGAWGDCSMNNISNYQPVTDTSYNVADFFGSSVSLFGEYAAVGIGGDDPQQINNAGSVNMYKHNGSSWTFTQKIIDNNPVSGGNFGQSISMDGIFIAIGAYGDNVGANADQGTVSVYKLIGSAWVFQQKITDPSGAADDNFGYSVSLNGNYLIIGSPKDDVGAVTNHGSACIYQYNGSSWVFMQKVTSGFVGANDDEFGYSVSISGNTAFIGMPFDDNGANANQGTVFVYEFNGTIWVVNTQLFQGTIGDAFGYSVSVSGNYAIIGAPYDDETFTSQGTVYVYRKKGSTWILLEKYTEEATENNALFGFAVHISGNYIMASAPYRKNGNNLEQGSTSIFTLPGNFMQKLQYIVEPNGKIGDRLGISVAVDGATKKFLIGCYKTGCVGLCFVTPSKAVFGKIK
jgi:FG-GAP repeat